MSLSDKSCSANKLVEWQDGTYMTFLATNSVLARILYKYFRSFVEIKGIEWGEKNNPLPSDKLSELVVRGMQEKKATDILVMDLRNIPNSVADYFILCSGNSDTQIEAISNSIEEFTFNESGENPYHVEGKQNLAVLPPARLR